VNFASILGAITGALRFRISKLSQSLRKFTRYLPAFDINLAIVLYELFSNAHAYQYISMWVLSSDLLVDAGRTLILCRVGRGDLKTGTSPATDKRDRMVRVAALRGETDEAH
jgi:hypothetical protein